MNPLKFYIVIRIADFQTWKSNNPATWTTWKPRMLNGFDVVGSTRRSVNGNYAVIENRLTWFNSRQRVQTFENLVSGITWLQIFPIVLTPAWIAAGYTQTIHDLFKSNISFWYEEITP